MAMTYQDDDLRLREHLHTLLHDYVNEHLVIDHDAYSRYIAEGILQENLLQVPLVTPTDVSVPVDPMQSLFRIWSIPATGMEPYDERWNVDEDAALFVKKSLKLLKPREKNLWLLHDEARYALREHLAGDYILSRKAIDATPTLGNPKCRLMQQASLAGMLAPLALGTITVEETDETVVDLDHVLSLRPHHDHDTSKAIQALISKLGYSRRAQPASQKSFLEEPRSHDCPPHPMTPPLFVDQGRNARSQGRPAGIGSMEELSRIIGNPVVVDEKQFDIPAESLKVVNGWSVLTPVQLSPPPPAGKPQGEMEIEEVDELWDLTPPDANAAPFAAARLDVVEIPRVHQLGYTRKSGPTQTLYGLLSSLQVITPVKEPLAAPTGPDPECISPSMLGQASSTIGGREEDDDDLASLDEDMALEQIYKSVKGHIPYGAIMDERIEQRQAWLMDVPLLPEPNVHPPSTLPMPGNMNALVPLAKPKKVAGTTTVPRAPDPFTDIRLSKAVGVQPLNIELSWRPFISGAASLPDTDGPSEIIEDNDALLVQTFLNLVEPQNRTSPRINKPMHYTDEPITIRKKSPSPQKLLLTRLERARLGYGRSGRDENFQAGDSTERQVEEESTPDLPEAKEITQDHSSVSWECSSSSRHRPANNSSPPRKVQKVDFTVPTKTPHTLTTPTASGNSNIEVANMEHSPHGPVSPNCPAVDPPEAAPSDEVNTNLRVDKARSLTTFMNLRGRTVTHLPDINASNINTTQNVPIPLPRSPSSISTPSAPRFVPPEIAQHVSFTISAERLGSPQAVHRYMASFELIQKRGIYNHLTSPNVGRAELIERLNLAGVDLILDPDSAVIFFVLAGLPSTKGADLLERLANHSWSFRRILVVFEAYPSSWSRQALSPAKKGEDVPYAFPPTVIKAFKQLRRSLVIAEANGTKHPGSTVEFVVALDELLAARYARAFGDRIEHQHLAISEESHINSWGDRSWLVDDEYENEGDLACFDGMNLFAAAVILSRVNFDSLIEDMDAQTRLKYLGPLVGESRVRRFNAIVEEKLLAILSSLSPEPHPIQYSSSTGNHPDTYLDPTENVQMLL